MQRAVDAPRRIALRARRRAIRLRWGRRAQSDGVLTTYTPQRQFVTVAPGPREAASIGSYAVRVYGARSPQFPTDDFLGGVVRKRDGTLQRLVWQDVLRNGSKELVVVCASAGSGGYLSADALGVRNGSVVVVASVKGLNPRADVLRALQAAARR